MRKRIHTTPATYATGLDIHQWLAEDQHTDFDTRLQRDHDIARLINAGTRPERKVQTVLDWWSHIDADTTVGKKCVAAVQLLSWILVTLGLLSGAGVSAAALAYDGSAPVNLLTLLGIMVGLPALLLLLTLISSTLTAVGLARLGTLFGPSFGSWKRWMMTWIDRTAGTEFHRIVGAKDTYADLGYWLMIVLSQRFAVAFFAAAMTTAWILVAVTDLAFGWSSTLNIHPESVHRWFTALAAPWQTWLPTAVPSFELVQGSQFFRMQTPKDADVVARLGDWWPFVMMCIAVWGLLPRLLLAAFARWRLHHAGRRFILDNAHVTALIDRLSTPSVQYRTTATDSSVPKIDASTVRAAPDATRLARLSWNSAAPNDVPDVIEVGSHTKRTQRVDALKKIDKDVDQIIVYTKSWEPPTLDALDFVELVAQSVSASTSIVVTPVPLPGEAVAEGDTGVWRNGVAKLGLQNVYVQPLRTLA